MRVRNPFHKSVERQWLWGELNDEQLRQRGERATVYGLWCHVATGFCLVAGFCSVPYFYLVSAADHWDMAHTLMCLGYLALTGGVAWATPELMDIEPELRKADPGSDVAREIDEMAQESPAAKEWRDEALWSGRALRVFDFRAMKQLSELEKEGGLIVQSAVEKRPALALGRSRA